jgi:hypothetical protein
LARVLGGPYRPFPSNPWSLARAPSDLGVISLAWGPLMCGMHGWNAWVHMCTFVTCHALIGMNLESTNGTCMYLHMEPHGRLHACMWRNHAHACVVTYTMKHMHAHVPHMHNDMPHTCTTS